MYPVRISVLLFSLQLGGFFPAYSGDVHLA